MSIKVFIDGGAGTTGLKLKSLLENDPQITLLSLPEALRKDDAAKAEQTNKSDITFLCLPDESARLAAAAASETARIIDASTAHRTATGWTYGLPELKKGQREAIQTSRRVSVPGCHASGFIALTYPLIEAGILTKESRLSCHSLTGYSGGGKAMIAAYGDANRPAEYAAPRIYGLGQAHKHLKEMCAATGLLFPPVFTPIIVDHYSGMAVTVPLHLGGAGDKSKVLAALKNHYKNERLITVHEDDDAELIAFSSLSGKNGMEIHVSGNDERVTLTALYDNLNKGAAGAALQCMNLMTGRDETAGLI